MSRKPATPAPRKQAEKEVTGDVSRREANPHFPSYRSLDYYQLVASAVSKLGDNSYEARQLLYDRARQALTHQLRGQDPARTASEQFALEATILRVEADVAETKVSASPQKPNRQYDVLNPTTALIVALILVPLLVALAIALLLVPGRGILH